MAPKGRVSPFGHQRIKACSRLPAAYRSVPRPSSPLNAKASTRRPLRLIIPSSISTLRPWNGREQYDDGARNCLFIHANALCHWHGRGGWMNVIRIHDVQVRASYTRESSRATPFLPACRGQIRDACSIKRAIYLSRNGESRIFRYFFQFFLLAQTATVWPLKGLVEARQSLATRSANRLRTKRSGTLRDGMEFAEHIDFRHVAFPSYQPIMPVCDVPATSAPSEKILPHPF